MDDAGRVWWRAFLSRWVVLCALVCCGVGVCQPQDPRDIRHALPIPTLHYADMPLVVTLNDGSWLCVLTTGSGEEGSTGQHITATRSTDQGQSWTEPVPIEAPSPVPGGESSWAVPLHVAHQGDQRFGRVYAFYIYNGDPVLEVPNREPPHRLDMLGWYVIRFSDDGGRTWSERTRLPVPLTLVDARGTFGGRAQMLWCISEPVVHEGAVLLPFTKIGVHLVGRTEGWILASDNLLTEPDATKHNWRLLPDGGDAPERAWQGIRSENFGDVQAEHHLVRLGDSRTIAVFYRTDRGVIAWASSRDGGVTWSEPEAVRYADGSPMRNPRANVKVWDMGAGRLLMWFHNHAGTTFADRNPAWIAGGLFRDGAIEWSQPEIAVYHPEPSVRISYPDLIRENGRSWLVYANKRSAAISGLDQAVLDGLWSQFDVSAAPGDRLAAGQIDARSPAASLGETGRLTIELVIDGAAQADGTLIASSGSIESGGWELRQRDDGALECAFSDAETTFRWTSEPGTLVPGRAHRIAIIVDGGADVVAIVADGRLQDGAGHRQFGWGRMPTALHQIPEGVIRFGANPPAALRCSDHAMSISEAVLRTRPD